jgi:PDZ domain-containing secreted protein
VASGDEQPGHERRPWTTWLGRIALVLVLVLGVASLVNAPYVVVLPGDPIDARALIEKRPEKAKLTGELAIPSVNEHRAKWVEVAWYKLTDDRRLEPFEQVERFNKRARKDQGDVDPQQLFAESREIAAYVAATAADVPTRLDGRAVRIRALGSDPKAPVKSGDVVVAYHDGLVVNLPLLLGNISQAPKHGKVEVGLDDGRAYRIAVVPPDERKFDSATAARALGVNSVMTNRPEAFVNGFAWGKASSDIAGNSSGLALALAAYEAITGEDLADERTVWATGELDEFGEVYAVGGIEQKAEAAQDADIDLLLVPEVEVDLARRHAPDVKVVGVKNIQGAVQALA